MTTDNHHPSTTPASGDALDQATLLRARLGLAEAATADAIEALNGAEALPGMTRRTLDRVLRQVQHQLTDAHRMVTTQAVLGARLLDTMAQGELQTRAAWDAQVTDLADRIELAAGL